MAKPLDLAQIFRPGIQAGHSFENPVTSGLNGKMQRGTKFGHLAEFRNEILAQVPRVRSDVANSFQPLNSIGLLRSDGTSLSTVPLP